MKNGSMKRTNLALHAKIPYDRFTNYLHMMILLNLVELSTNEETILVNITAKGREFLDTLSGSEHW